MQQPKAMILGCKGTELTGEERRFFAAHNPVGFILFARNIDSPAQVSALISELKSLVSHDKCLLLVDQEGGRVARLGPPYWQSYLPAAQFAALGEVDLQKAARAVYLNHRLIGDELYEVGFNVDCAPVLDMPVSGSDPIISDRALGVEPRQVSVLARAACEGLLDACILPVIKHIPGHGRAMVDSHLALPLVDTDIDMLECTDFAPFHALADMPFAMSAHVKYTVVDAEACATLSQRVVGIIRTQIGFGGVILTDDLSMKALSGSFTQRTKAALHAGCDIILHCNGDIEEMRQIADVTPCLDAMLWSKLGDACKVVEKAPLMFDRDAAFKEMDLLLKSSAI